MIDQLTFTVNYKLLPLAALYPQFSVLLSTVGVNCLTLTFLKSYSTTHCATCSPPHPTNKQKQMVVK